MNRLLLPISLASLALLGCESATEDKDASPLIAPPASTPTENMPAPEVPDVELTTNGPAITFEFEDRDFGEIWDFQPVTTTFPFRNTGNKILVLKQLKAGCGCTVPVADKTVLKPGESGTITVTFDPKGKSNKEDKKVTIISNATNDPEKGVWIRSYVNQFVRVTNRFLKVNDMVLGEPRSIEFEFFPADPNFKIENMVGIGKHGDYISAEEIEVPDSAPRRIRITVDPNMKWGAFHSQLKISGTGKIPGGSEKSHEFTVFANGNAFGKLKADDFIMSVGSRKGGEAYHVRNKLFRLDGEPFKVLNTAVLSPTISGINLTSVQNFDGSYDLIVTGTIPLNHRGPINAELMVQTDLPGQEEVLYIRLAGVVPKR